MNFALISLSTQMVKGPRALREAIGSMAELQVEKVSSVYKRLDPETEGTLASEILMVLGVTTAVDLKGLQNQIKMARVAFPSVEWTLLSFNHDVRLDPEYPVPHPALHTDPMILHCAAEVEGVFEHPVLGRSLQELVKSSQSSRGTPDFEFLMRGETLLGPNSLEVP